MYGKAALKLKAADKLKHQEGVRVAVEFARFHDRGAKWAMDNGDFLPSVTWKMVDDGLHGRLKYVSGDRRKDEILTETEAKALNR